MCIETWRFINTFAPWFSAFGTISAVAVSLYLARAEKPIKIKAKAAKWFFVIPSLQSPQGTYPEYLQITATNVGHRTVIVTQFGWEIGLFRKKQALQTFANNPYSTDLPAKLDDGEKVTWSIPLEGEYNWAKSFSKEFLLPYPRWNLFWLKLLVNTSVGKTFKGKINKNLKAKLLDECKKQRQSA